MFIYEFDTAECLLGIYKNSIVEEELLFDEWMDGEYKYIVPDILAQLIDATRFMKYMSHAIYNDEYPNDFRKKDEDTIFDDLEENRRLWAEYKGIFDDLSRAIALHLIDQKEDIPFDRQQLREGVWTEENYYNFLSITRVMDTMCLLCDKVFETYHNKNEHYMDADRERQDNIICPWDTDYLDYPWENEEDPYAGDNIEPIHPPFWVRAYHE